MRIFSVLVTMTLKALPQTMGICVSPSRVKVSFRLVAGDRTLPSTQFGTVRREGRYLAFLEAVRAAVGDKLVREEDLGELEEPLRRMAEPLVSAGALTPGQVHGIREAARGLVAEGPTAALAPAGPWFEAMKRQLMILKNGWKTDDTF